MRIFTVLFFLAVSACFLFVCRIIFQICVVKHKFFDFSDTRHFNVLQKIDTR